MNDLPKTKTNKSNNLSVFFYSIIIIAVFSYLIFGFSALVNKNKKEKQEQKKEKNYSKEESTFKNYKIENKGDLALDLKGVNTLEVKNSGNLNMAVSTDYVGTNLTASDCNERFVFHSRSTCQ